MYDLLGYRIEDAIPYFDSLKKEYKIYEIGNPKNFKLGNEKRIVKITDDEYIKIFVAYF